MRLPPEPPFLSTRVLRSGPAAFASDSNQARKAQGCGFGVCLQLVAAYVAFA
jgi:hypothetical protein